MIPCPDDRKRNLQPGSSKPCGDAGGVHSIIQADAASRRGLIQGVMPASHSYPLAPLDDKGQLIQVGDVVRVLGIPDHSRWTPAQKRFSLGVFRHIRGTCKRVASFDKYGFVELFFFIRKGKDRGIHSVALEPYLLRVQRKRA